MDDTKFSESGHIVLQPLTIKWSAWREFARSPIKHSRDVQEILREVSAWQKRVDMWLTSLSERQKHDLLQLAMAEIDMLFCALDHAEKDSPHYEDEREDFRTRYFELEPLVATCQRLGVKDIKRVDNALNDLERYATERMEWLP